MPQNAEFILMQIALYFGRSSDYTEVKPGSV